MAYDTGTANPDSAALSARLAELRLLVEDNAAHVRGLDLPETWLEAERAARAIDVADRFLQLVPPSPSCEAGTSVPGGGTIERSEEGGRVNASEDVAPEDAGAEDPAASPVHDPHRLALRTFADKVMAKAKDIAKPTSFLEGERAARYGLSARRMLVQLYEAPKPRLSGRITVDDEDEGTMDGTAPNDVEAWKVTLERRLNDLARRRREREAAARPSWVSPASADSEEAAQADASEDPRSETAETPPDAAGVTEPPGPEPDPPPRQSMFAPGGRYPPEVQRFNGISDPDSHLWPYRG